MKVVLFAFLFFLICAVAWYRTMDFRVRDRSVIVVLDDRTLSAEAYKEIQRGAEVASRNLHVRVAFRKDTVHRDALRDQHPDAVVVLYDKDPGPSDDNGFIFLDVAGMTGPFAAGYAAVLMGRVEFATMATGRNRREPETKIEVAPPGTSRPYSVFRDDVDRFIVV